MSEKQAEIYIGNTIEYDVKSYQLKTTIVTWTKVNIKGLNFNRSPKDLLVFPTSIRWNKTNLKYEAITEAVSIGIGIMQVPDLKYAEDAQTKIHKRHTT